MHDENKCLATCVCSTTMYATIRRYVVQAGCIPIDPIDAFEIKLDKNNQ